MSWEDNTGPRCTEEQALELLDRLIASFPSQRVRTDSLPVYVERMQGFPHEYVQEAVVELTEGRFMPSPGEIVARARQIWPPKDHTGEEERMRDGRGSAVAGR